MPQAIQHDEMPVYDIVGIGFGPSNLALAVAVTEQNARSADTTTAVFLERQPRFGWHRGMLLDDATMQVSFLKDLVTLRDPTSEYSFLCYLRDQGRLMDFINHKNLYPLRIEFHDYLEWAAAKVDDLVLYGHEVTTVEPIVVDGELAYFDVHAGAGVYRARNLVFATGLVPNLPDGMTASDRVWHNRDLLHKVGDLAGTSPKRFVVVGAGQSAAEALAYLHREFADAEVCGVFARYGYSPADDSSFANRIFDPAAVEEFYSAPDETKRMMLGYHANTNYSVVDGDLIQDIYGRVYQEKVLGRERLRLLNVSRVTELVETGDGVRATVESLLTGERTVLDADAVVCATGYRPADPFASFADVARYCHRDDLGRPLVERDYAVVTDPSVRCGIYLQGGTEHTHGITSSLLSNTAVRAGEILGAVNARTPAVAPKAAAPLANSAVPA